MCVCVRAACVRVFMAWFTECEFECECEPRCECCLLSWLHHQSNCLENNEQIIIALKVDALRSNYLGESALGLNLLWDIANSSRERDELNERESEMSSTGKRDEFDGRER